MRKRLVEEKLREFIRHEIMALVPCKPREVMSESRAYVLANDVISEGAFDALISLFAGQRSASTTKATDASNLGKSALAVVPQVTRDAKEIATTSKQISAATKQMVSRIADKKLRAASDDKREFIKTSLKTALKKAAAKSIIDLVKAGATEEEAKGIVSSEILAAFGDYMTFSQ